VRLSFSACGVEPYRSYNAKDDKQDQRNNLRDDVLSAQFVLSVQQDTPLEFDQLA